MKEKQKLSIIQKTSVWLIKCTVRRDTRKEEINYNSEI